jgi:hypothetical protein
LARKCFVPGPFHLGRYGVPVGWIAVVWVATITVLFSLPVSYPVAKDTLNYTPVAVGGLFALVLSSWILGTCNKFGSIGWCGVDFFSFMAKQEGGVELFV